MPARAKKQAENLFLFLLRPRMISTQEGEGGCDGPVVGIPDQDCSFALLVTADKTETGQAWRKGGRGRLFFLSAALLSRWPA
jgi:hypothetical protein